MPKSYSEQEKEYIIKRLKEEAGKCLAQYGIRRTTVDEIVNRVKIPKGTFYLFYRSKELLLFDVILEQHSLIEQKMQESINSLNRSNITPEQLTNIVFQFFKMAEETPILKMINSDEIELLVRKLPPNVLEEHLAHDHSMIENLFAMLPLKSEVNLESIMAAFRAIYFSTLHKEEIGEKNYDEALHCLIYGLIIQIL